MTEQSSKERLCHTVVVLYGEHDSPYLKMAHWLRAQRFAIIVCSSHEEFECFAHGTARFDLGIFDLTSFDMQDMPLLVRTAQRLRGNGLIRWSCSIFRPELEAELDRILGGTYVHV